jgi:hypothetical protein
MIKELLGHEDLVTTQIYARLQKQNLMGAVNLLYNHISISIIKKPTLNDGLSHAIKLIINSPKQFVQNFLLS